MAELKVMSLNMHNSISAREFTSRIGSLNAMISFHQPDLIGVQELTDEMVRQLTELSETYVFYGKARECYQSANERCCVLYRRDRFRFLNGMTRWLSNDPEIPGSKIYGSLFPRIVTIAELEDSVSGKQFIFANTHLDHLLAPVRTKQAEILAHILKAQAPSDFMILTGDFNSPLHSQPLQILTKDPELQLWDTVPVDAKSTIRNFIQSSASNYRPIDHILISRSITTVKSETITGLYMGSFPSDHCPILTSITLPDPEKPVSSQEEPAEF